MTEPEADRLTDAELTFLTSTDDGRRLLEEVVEELLAQVPDPDAADD